jgi:hypothetical protein
VRPTLLRMARRRSNVSASVSRRTATSSCGGLVAVWRVARLWHRLWHGTSRRNQWDHPRERVTLRFRLLEPPQQKTPRRGGGALLGLLQGGEICISIYVDPWEVGEPSLCRGAPIVGSNRGHIYDARLSQKVFCPAPSSVSLDESLISVRTYVRFVCEGDHSSPLRGGQKRVFPGLLVSK